MDFEKKNPENYLNYTNWRDVGDCLKKCIKLHKRVTHSVHS